MITEFIVHLAVAIALAVAPTGDAQVKPQPSPTQEAAPAPEKTPEQRFLEATYLCGFMYPAAAELQEACMVGAYSMIPGAFDKKA